ncbi:MAG TPA: hypothetical protein DHW78_10150 [Ruminococcaceae bacterium]|jgi:hypothetical protein|nr:hypothetical protein [Oscillospiraceae bacterium]HCM24667.1 hypothetical protein [Oscillospiraceae bacterium]
MIALVIVSFCLILIFSLPYLLTDKSKYDRTVFFIFYFSIFVICLLEGGGVNLPSPILGLDELLKWLHLSY